MNEPSTDAPVDKLMIPRSAADIARFQSDRKRWVVRQAMQSPFHAKRLAGIDIDRLDEPEMWRRIPILDKDELRALSDQQFYTEFCHPTTATNGIAEFWRSGGTTGRPLFYPRSHEDIEAAMLGFSRVFACAGATAGQRVHASFPLGIHPAGQMMARAAERADLPVLWAGAGTTTPSGLQLELLHRLGAKVWMGMSSYGLHLANLADQNGIDLASGAVELVICSAEPLSAAKREKLERMWGATVRDSFGMTEAGMMGAEDGEADGFRVWSDLFLTEVVHPETREPVVDGEVGALVVTPLMTANITPFVRWLSGDLVTQRLNVAGRTPFSVFPVVKHAHRTAGFFKVRGININHAELEDFVFRNPAVNDFKCEALTFADKDVLRVSVELKRGTDADRAVAGLVGEIRNTFEMQAEIVVLESGTLAREFESSVKAPRIVDRR